MKKFRDFSFPVTVLLFIAHLVVWCNGDDDQILEASLMEKTEQEALYYAIQGFVGNQWNGSDLYPDPCGWTPIQVIPLLHFFITKYSSVCMQIFILVDSVVTSCS